MTSLFHHHFPFLSNILPIFLLLLTLPTSSRVIFNGYEIRDMFNVYPEFQTDSLLWTQSASPSTTNPTTSCGSMIFYGGSSVFPYATYDYVYTTYNTPTSHNVLYYTISFTIVDYWDINDGFNIFFVSPTGTESVSWIVDSAFSNSLCQSDIKVKGKILHSGATLGLRIQKRLNLLSTFGFRKISILLGNSAGPSTSERFCLSSESFTQHSIVVNSQCTCTSGTYFSGSACVTCDDSCEECYDSGSTGCYACKFGYYYDGTQCTPCTKDCIDCETCGICSEFDYYFNGSCVPTCESPLLSSVAGDYKFCFSPCKSTEVLYADGTCQSTCVSPLTLVPVQNIPTMEVCRSLCSAGQTLLYTGECSPSPCQYPLFDILYGGSMTICKYPCDDPTEIYYKHNKSCMSSCNYPYVTKNYGTFDTCEPPCPDGYFFRYWDNTCQADCPPLLQQTTLSEVRMCEKPLCGVVLCDYCAGTLACPAYYWCNTTLGAFCMPHYTQNIEVEEFKPILNGVILSVVIKPGLGVKASEDILKFDLPELKTEIDYRATIERVSFTKYKIVVVLLQTIKQTEPLASFKYAPYTLGLSLNYRLPRMVFISSNLQAVSQSTGKGSQVAFIIFVITILGYIFEGGLASVWTAIPESQYAYYLLYLNIDYLHHTNLYLESLSNYDVLVGNYNPDDTELDIQYKRVLPRKFFVRGYNPDFFENTKFLFFQAMFTVFFVGTSSLILQYLRFSGRHTLLLKTIAYIRKSLMWNLVIRQALTYALPLSIASFIQIYSIIFDYKAYLFDTILSIATLFGLMLGCPRLLSLIDHVPKTKHDAIMHLKKFGTLWDEIDLKATSRYYYVIITLRGCLLAYLAVFLSTFPYIQIGALLLYQLFIVSLFFKRFKIRPVFTNSVLNKFTLAEETCLLLVKCSVLISMIMRNNNVGDKTLILVGWFSIIPAALAQVLQIFYSIGSQVIDPRKLINLYKRIKIRLVSKKKIKRKMRKMRLQNIKIHHPESRP